MRRLLLALLLLPAIEIGVFIWIGGKIGPLWVVLLILFTGIIGLSFAKMQGTRTLQRAKAQMNQGQAPTDEMLNGICIFIGAIFLLSPGFVTDTIGLSFVLPFTRKPIKKLLSRFIKQRINQGSFIYRKW